MRKFRLSDVMLLSEIIDILDIDLDLQGLLEKTDKSMKTRGSESDSKVISINTTGNNTPKEITERVGGQLFMQIISKMHKADYLVYKFIAGFTTDTPEDVKNYSISDMKNFFSELMKSDDFATFFRAESTDEA